MAYPLQYDSGQDVDFVDLLTDVSYRTGHQLVRLAFCACCLVLLMVGKVDGQTAPAPSTSPSSRQRKRSRSEVSPLGEVYWKSIRRAPDRTRSPPGTRGVGTPSPEAP